MKDMLTGIFNEQESAKVLENKIKSEDELDLQLSQKEIGLLNAGRIEVAQSSHSQFRKQKTEKERKRHQDFLMLLETTRRNLMLHIEQLQEEIDKILKQRDKVSQTLEALDKFLKDYLENNGQFSLDEFGRARDPLVQEVMEEWEKETGQEWDSSSRLVQNNLRSLLDQKKTQYDQLSGLMLSKQTQQERLIDQLETLDEMKQNKQLNEDNLDLVIGYLEIDTTQNETRKKLPQHSEPKTEIELTNLPSPQLK